jgi:hypothetical protein
MYKVFMRRCIDGVHFEANRFDFDFELVAKLIRLGNIPIEIPVSYVSRGFDEGKKVRIFRDPFTWIRAIVTYRFSRLYSNHSKSADVSNDFRYLPHVEKGLRCANGDF